MLLKNCTHCKNQHFCTLHYQCANVHLFYYDAHYNYVVCYIMCSCNTLQSVVGVMQKYIYDS